MIRYLVFLNGPCGFGAELSEFRREGDVVVAADGGYRHAVRCGMPPTLLVGDFDSLDSGEVRDENVTVRRYGSEKDASDLELLIDELEIARPAEIVLFGGLGGRLDHSLMVLDRVERLAEAGHRVSLLDSNVRAEFLGPGAHTLEGRPGDTITFVPRTDTVAGFSLRGLKWTLDDVRLVRGSSLTLSNRFVETGAGVTIGEGRVLSIHTAGNSTESA